MISNEKNKESFLENHFSIIENTIDEIQLRF